MLLVGKDGDMIGLDAEPRPGSGHNICTPLEAHSIWLGTEERKNIKEGLSHTYIDRVRLKHQT